MSRIGLLAVMTVCVLITGCRNTTHDVSGSVKARLQAGSTETVSATGGVLAGASVTFSGLAETADVSIGGGPRQDIADWIAVGPVVDFTATNVQGMPASFFSATITVPYDVNAAGPIHLYTQQTTETPTRVFNVTLNNGLITATVSHFSRFWALAPAPAPAVFGVTPQFIPYAGGFTATVSGNAFLTSGQTSVAFGPNSATDVVVHDQNRITCTVPAGTVGWTDVTVTTMNGSGTLANAIRYYDPSNPDSNTQPNIPDPPPAGETGTPSGTWEDLTDGAGPGARDFPGSASASDGTGVFLFGGYNQNGIPLNDGWVFSHATDTWSQVSSTDAPSSRGNPITLTVGDSYLVFGGDGFNGEYQNSGGFYHPGTDTWTPIPPVEVQNGTMSTDSHANHPVSVPDNSSYGVWVQGRLVLMGGFDVIGNTYRNDVWVYNPAPHPTSVEDVHEAGEWIQLNGLNSTTAPVGRVNHHWVTDGTYCYLFGGYGGSGAPSAAQVLGDFWRFDPMTLTWTEITTAGKPAAAHEGSAIWTGTELVFWGGVNANSESINTGARYNPTTDTWTAMSTTGAPVARSHAKAVRVGSDHIVFLGGFDELGDRAVRGGVYRISNNSWTVPTSVGRPGPRSGFAVVGGSLRVIVYGGSNFVFGQGSTYYGETWSFAPDNVVVPVNQ